MIADVVNAIFEGGGAILLTMNVRRLYLDKKLAGVALPPTIWFNVWGAWNLYYYFAIGQRASWCAGMGVFLVNSAWVSLAIYYTRRKPAPTRGEWMQTRSGLAYYPTDPRPEEVRIEDIASGLSKDCRYAGQCSEFYSTAEHSVIVSCLVPPHFALEALLHDAPEAYLRDMPRPVKIDLPDYRRLEKLNARAIGARFGVDLVNLPDEVKLADRIALQIERRKLMKPPPLAWRADEQPLPEPRKIPEIAGLSCEDAERLFMIRFRQLTEEVAA